MACQGRYLLLPLLLLLAAGAQGRRLLQANDSKPNFILFAHDDRLLEEMFTTAHDSIIKGSGVKNPNGCLPAMTWFINCCAQGKVSSKCEWVQKAHEAGHEIATHTMTHSNDTLNYTYDEWVAEIQGQRDWTVDECGIPEDVVTGFRAPYYQVNELLGQVLEDLGWVEYDSSLKGEYKEGDGTPMQAGPLSADNSSGLVPYVPDCHEDTTANRCDGWVGLDFWEVPAYTPPGNGSRRSDPEDLPGFSIVQRLTADFDRKKGTGVPVGINVHGPYLRDDDQMNQIIAFFQYAFSNPNTWGVTYQQYIAWKKAGSPDDPTEVLADYPCDDSQDCLST